MFKIIGQWSLRNLSRHRNPKCSAQNLSISFPPPFSLQICFSIPTKMSSQSIKYPSQFSTLESVTASSISCSPTILRLTCLLSSRTLGSIPGTESSLNNNPIRASLILILSLSLVRTESTVSCRWMILCQYLASELTAAILLTRVRTM